MCIYSCFQLTHNVAIYDRMIPSSKENPFTLLVGMQTSTATMENSVEIP